MPAPTNPDSLSGVSRIRSGPNSSSRPLVTANDAAVAADVLAHQEHARVGLRAPRAVPARAASRKVIFTAAASGVDVARELLERLPAAPPRPRRRRASSSAAISASMTCEVGVRRAAPPARIRCSNSVIGSRCIHSPTSSFVRYSSASYIEWARKRYVRSSRNCGPPPLRAARAAARTAASTATHVHAVDDLRRDAVAARLEVDVRLGLRALERGPHGVEVVLAQEHDRQLPERREVERLVELALGRRALAEEARGHARPLLHRVGQREADGHGQAGGDDREAAVEVPLGVEEVHRPAAAAAAAVRLAEELGHERARRGRRARGRGRARDRCRRSRRPGRAPASRPSRSPPRRCRGAGSRAPCRGCRARRSAPRSGGCGASAAAAASACSRSSFGSTAVMRRPPASRCRPPRGRARAP